MTAPAVMTITTIAMVSKARLIAVVIIVFIAIVVCQPSGVPLSSEGEFCRPKWESP